MKCKGPLSIGTHSSMETSKGNSIVVSMAEFVGRIRELEEQTNETTHHNFVTVLKEIACNPVPHVSPHIVNIFKDLQRNTYNRKEFVNRLRESGVTNDYDWEELDEIIQKLEASRGYSEKETKRLINYIRTCHSYNKSMITKMLETLNVPDQYTILHYGALFNNVSFCRCLINDFNCDVNLVSWDGETLLHIAARLANAKHPDRPSSILEYLVNHPKIKINIQESHGRTPLHFAVIYNCIGNAKYLIECGANIDIPDIHGAIALHYACRCLENDTMIGLFLNIPRLFHRETRDKKKFIDIAIEYNDPKMIKHFFDQRHMRDVNDTTNVTTLEKGGSDSPENKVLSFLEEQYEEVIDRDDSMLHFACHQLHGQKTISHLTNPNSVIYQDKETGLSPLMIAVQHRQLPCVKELLNSTYFTPEAFELVSNVSFRTVLHVCAKVHNDEITKTLFDSRFMSSTLAAAADVMGNTPLHICAQVGNVYMAQLLLGYISNSNSSMTTFPQSSATRANEGTSHHRSVSTHVHAMLIKKNKKRLTPLHVAIQAANMDVINEMLKYADPSVINVCDDQLRTSLHMAAAKGHIDIIDVLLQHRVDSHVCDINEWTPLHYAAKCDGNVDEKERSQCIECLVICGMSNINALTIRRETPLHVACKYGTSKLVKQLIKLDCDLFATNIDNYNCLEVAIETNNEDVVRYLIESDDCFDLMRNSQIPDKKRSWRSLLARQCKVDTPMRKLIRKMPQMALLVLDKCSMIVGAEGTVVHQNIFMYEFIEDQFTVNKWTKDTSKNVTQDELYTSNAVNLVMNHPLFLMAQYEAYDLMSHPLSDYLLKLKFKKFGIFLYVLLLLLYSIYLGLFTTIVLRTHHPGMYYNLTNIDFQDSLCYNVSQALLTASPSLGGIKTKIDYTLKYAMYVAIWSLFFKNMFNIIEISQISFSKTLRYWLETVAVVVSFIFVHDRSYQMNLTLRCPLQWEYGAFALLLSWLTLLGYIQFMPIVGLYVTMLLVISKKFMRFSAILLILISGFAVTFYMVFQNFEPFQNAGYSYIRTAFMISGELGFDERMYDENTKAYYKVAFLIYILFVLIMTVFVTNLLIGLAVGEIPPLLKQASDNLNRLFYELVATCEVFRYRIIWILCRGDMNDTIAYSYQDLDKKKWYKRLGSRLLKRYSDPDDDDDDDTEVNTDKLLE